jgi:hypothetical protein
MLRKVTAILTVGFVSASLAVAPSAGDALAGEIHHRNVIAAHPRPSSCVPYYYSRWNPYSLYSIYDHLSGGRQLCYLPSECCDNNHRSRTRLAQPQLRARR